MSYNKSLFQGVPKKQVNKSRFNLSHEWKGQGMPGLLMPVLTMETLPNDEWDIQSEFMFRFSPLYFPIMQKMTMRADYFFVPNRITWIYQGESNKGWTRWITEMEEYEHPTCTPDMNNLSVSGFASHVLAFMGIPLQNETLPGTPGTIAGLNALPLSAYLKIWDEYYRVPQLEDEKWFPLEPGDNTTAFNTAFNTGDHWLTLSAKWEKDYFTSALPTPQVGEAVRVPLVGTETELALTTVNGPFRWKKVADDTPIDGDVITQTVAGEVGVSTIGGNASYLDIDETASNIKQLRIAETLQGYYERLMKIGQRYRDYIQGFWGNDPEPNVIDVPVLLGSKFGRVQISDVMTQASYDYAAEGATSRTGDYTGQANLYAQDGDTIKYTCREHGFIMCILQVNANTSYGQGIHRMWRRTLQTDYPLDVFSNIGDQEILKEELFYTNVTANAAKNQDTFGYIPRHSEMRYANSIFVNQLAHEDLFGGGGLGLSQHLGRWIDPQDIDLDTDVILDADFLESWAFARMGHRLTDVFRTLPYSSGQQYPDEGLMYMHIFHSIYVNRVLPLYATPKL